MLLGAGATLFVIHHLNEPDHEQQTIRPETETLENEAARLAQEQRREQELRDEEERRLQEQAALKKAEEARQRQAELEKKLHEKFGSIEKLQAILDSRDSSSEDQQEAFRRCLKLAQDGDVKAMTMVGVAYWSGNGVDRDANEAVAWFKKAAPKGDSRAMLGLGTALLAEAGPNGEKKNAVEWLTKAAEAGEGLAMERLGNHYGEIQNWTEAKLWWERAVEQDIAAAKTNLAMLYRVGKGVEQPNITKAIELFQEAADSGEMRAISELGYICYSGLLPGKGPDDAARYFEQGAEFGDPRAITGLGVCYYYGRGVKKDLKEAKKLFTRSSEMGDAHAKKLLTTGTFSE